MPPDLTTLPSSLARRARIFDLEMGLKGSIARGEIEGIECPLNHTFAEGVYVRQMFIPKGVALVGHIHKHPCVNIVLGKIMVASEEGERLIEGPVTFPSAAGIKRTSLVS